jgi:glyoxylase-like metal-dependent hydrolase (beta-lactamase superfamily II)
MVAGSIPAGHTFTRHYVTIHALPDHGRDNKTPRGCPKICCRTAYATGDPPTCYSPGPASSAGADADLLTGNQPMPAEREALDPGAGRNREGPVQLLSHWESTSAWQDEAVRGLRRVLEIPWGYINAHLVVVDDGVVLVDTGPARRTRAFAWALRDTRRVVGDVHTILVTHWHPDHVGGLAELRGASGARVVAHAADAPTISGERPEPTKCVRVARLVMGGVRPTPVNERLTVDGPLSVPGFSAVHTPGHTAGHVSYVLDRGGGVPFVGDVAGSRRGGVHSLSRISGGSGAGRCQRATVRRAAL